MTHYVVRHIKTEKMLPQLAGRGSSSWEPDHPDPELSWEQAPTPRLFISKQAARNFISQWVKGVATAGYEYDDFIGAKYKSNEVLYEPQPHRSRDQLEIVPVELQFGEPL
jgi:hypothetical protein